MVTNNPSFILFTYFSKDTQYNDVLTKHFLPSAMKMKTSHNLDYKISVIENQGSWYRNVAEKSKTILDQLELMKYNNDNRNLLYIDSDASIEIYPEICETIPKTFDMALHYLDWKSWYGKGNSNVKETLTGTLFFHNTEKVRNFLKYWYDKSKENMNLNISGQKTLQKILKENPNILNIFDFPLEMCYINTLPNGKKPIVNCENPIIIHHQASRLYKRKII